MQASLLDNLTTVAALEGKRTSLPSIGALPGAAKKGQSPPQTPDLPSVAAAGAPQTRMMIDSPPLTKVSIGSVPSSALSPAGPSPAHTPSAHDIWIRRDLTGLPVSDEQLRATFQEYDKDGNGYLSRSEFRREYAKFDALGAPLSKTTLDRLFSKFDGGDNKISFEEFSFLMLQRSNW